MGGCWGLVIGGFGDVGGGFLTGWVWGFGGVGGELGLGLGRLAGLRWDGWVRGVEGKKDDVNSR